MNKFIAMFLVLLLAFIANTGAEDTVKISTVIDGHVVQCYRAGYLPHPTDVHKYVVCDEIVEGPKKGWWVRVGSCAPNSVWDQKILNCKAQTPEPEIKCTKAGKFAHPKDVHKYIVCEYIEGKGWWLQVKSCWPDRVWNEHALGCIVEETVKIMTVIDGHVVKCYRAGFLPHPTDEHKYVVCKEIVEGPKKRWWVQVMSCAPDTVWNVQTSSCRAQTPEPVLKCTKAGYFAHPKDVHKYVICEYQEGKGWYVHVMSCASAMVWDEKALTCIAPKPVYTALEGEVIKCTKAGMFAYPKDVHKYVVCEYDEDKGWWVHVMSCKLGTKWEQQKQICIEE